MNESGSHIRHSGCYNWNEIRAARKKTGECKQHLEERGRKETKMQDVMQQGGDAMSRMIEVPASRDGLYTLEPYRGQRTRLRRHFEDLQVYTYTAGGATLQNARFY
jgi:hypothetical protein